jgi:hypothetical protein
MKKQIEKAREISNDQWSEVYMLESLYANIKDDLVQHCKDNMKEIKEQESLLPRKGVTQISIVNETHLNRLINRDKVLRAEAQQQLQIAANVIRKKLKKEAVSKDWRIAIVHHSLNESSYEDHIIIYWSDEETEVFEKYNYRGLARSIRDGDKSTPTINSPFGFNPEGLEVKRFQKDSFFEIGEIEEKHLKYAQMVLKLIDKLSPKIQTAKI